MHTGACVAKLAGKRKAAFLAGVLVSAGMGCAEVPKPPPPVAEPPPPPAPPLPPAHPGPLEPCCESTQGARIRESKLLGGRPLLEVECPHVPRGWSRVASAQTQEWLVKTARALAGQSEQPDPCQLQAYLRCAPDFDGDGLNDWLVRLRWSVPVESLGGTCDGAEGDASGMGMREFLFLVAPLSRDEWTPLGGMRSAIRQGLTDFERTVEGFAQLEHGRLALHGGTRQAEPGFECDLLGEWVGYLEHGALRVLQETKPEPCGGRSPR